MHCERDNSEISLSNVKEKFGDGFSRKSSVGVNVHDEVQLDILGSIESADDADGPFGDDVMLQTKVSTTHCAGGYRCRCRCGRYDGGDVRVICRRINC